MTPNPTPTSIVAGLDIGGTSSRIALYALDEHGHVLDEPLIEESFPTRHGEQALKEQFAQLVDWARRNATQQGGEIVAFGIGAPGDYATCKVPDAAVPGTLSNLEAFRGELDYKPIVKWFRDAASPTPIVWDNDAIIQCMGILDVEAAEFAHLPAGTVVSYMGPGTGLGAAFARKHPAGHFEPVGNSHYYDLMLPLPTADMADIQQRIATYHGHHYLESDRILAEDIISGTAIEKLTGLGRGGLKALSHNDPQMYEEFVQEHAPLFNIIGRAIAVLVECILTKDIIKRDIPWEEKDKDIAAQTTVFIISGGISRAPLIGERILQAAEAELKVRNLPVSFNLAESNPATDMAAHVAARHLLLHHQQQGRSASR